MTSKERKNRSFHYQYILLEINVSDEFWLLKEDELHIALPLSTEKREFLLDLDEQIFNEINNIMESNLTTKQKQIVNLIKNNTNITQAEIGKELNIIQPTVRKAIFGNTSYYKNKINKYGGIYFKLQKLIKQSPNIHKLILQIEPMYEPERIVLFNFETVQNIIGSQNIENWHKWHTNLSNFNLKTLSTLNRSTVRPSLKNCLKIREDFAKGSSKTELVSKYKIPLYFIQIILGDIHEL